MQSTRSTHLRLIFPTMGCDVFGRDKQAGPLPSWEYFAAAASTPMPLYRLELAKSGRSR